MLSFPSQVFPQKRKDVTQLERYNMLIQISELVYLCKHPAAIIKMRSGKFQLFSIFKRKDFLSAAH